MGSVMCIYLFLLVAMGEPKIDNKILIYDNYIQKEIDLNDELDSLKTMSCFYDSILVDIESLKKISKTQKLSKNLFDILCEQDIINQWSEYKDSDLNPFSKNYKEFVAERKQDIALYYFGKVEVSKIFDSYLVLAVYGKYDEYNVIRTLYLMNTIDNKLKSITRVALYVCFDGSSNYVYTKVLGGNRFLIKEKVISTDLKISETLNNKSITQDDILYSNFFYDKEGYLVIQR
jgi:hypothetical protein